MLSSFVLVGGQAAEWTQTSPTDGQTVFACTGDTVTLAWEYKLSQDERAGDAKWKTGANLDKPVAMISDGRFFAQGQQYIDR
jgi:hypothetical protein